MTGDIKELLKIGSLIELVVLDWCIGCDCLIKKYPPAADLCSGSFSLEHYSLSDVFVPYNLRQNYDGILGYNLASPGKSIDIYIHTTLRANQSHSYYQDCFVWLVVSEDVCKIFNRSSKTMTYLVCKIFLHCVYQHISVSGLCYKLEQSNDSVYTWSYHGLHKSHVKLWECRFYVHCTMIVVRSRLGERGNSSDMFDVWATISGPSARCNHVHYRWKYLQFSTFRGPQIVSSYVTRRKRSKYCVSMTCVVQCAVVALWAI